MPATRRRISKHTKQEAARLTGAAITLLALLVVTFWVSRIKAPSRVHLFELLWAAAHRPVFYWVIILLTSSAACSFVAWRHRGEHRAWLIGAWLIGTTVIIGRFGDEVGAMLRVIWWQMTG